MWKEGRKESKEEKNFFQEKEGRKRGEKKEKERERKKYCRYVQVCGTNRCFSRSIACIIFLHLFLFESI